MFRTTSGIDRTTGYLAAKAAEETTRKELCWAACSSGLLSSAAGTLGGRCFAGGRPVPCRPWSTPPSPAWDSQKRVHALPMCPGPTSPGWFGAVFRLHPYLVRGLAACISFHHHIVGSPSPHRQLLSPFTGLLVSSAQWHYLGLLRSDAQPPVSPQAVRSGHDETLLLPRGPGAPWTQRSEPGKHSALRATRGGRPLGRRAHAEARSSPWSLCGRGPAGLAYSFLRADLRFSSLSS